MLKLAIVGVAVVLAMVAVKDGRIPRLAGLVGSCSAVIAPLGEEGAWQACRPGRLEGRPDLSRHACTSHGIVAEIEVWRCPAVIAVQRHT